MTNAERFAPLVADALTWLDELAARYAVTRDDAFDPPRSLGAFTPVRSPVRLRPATASAAPIAVAVTSFPSLVVHCGHWHLDSFPSCGCDACAEDAPGELARLRGLVGAVVAGQFEEWIRGGHLFGTAHIGWAYGGQVAQGPMRDRRSGSLRIPGAEGRALRRRAGVSYIRWQPWPGRAVPVGMAPPAV